ncbi:molecular chaperone OsmY [Prodigiosinella confusarubida]|uniref:Osmotically-inducible protein Y n=1 Tax=Serratia sp. (strain ATCC 39006) TaxID=104623 RepID=A0A2I5TDL2_SERS3|nr:molecular chaperone OsmY [Serratia sp. ATCC 39006]AUH02656.1 molecular chaperone OsmY [Serratia sp. ATCC 39006]AUH06969.1 molecular chaperone OsmY [Serratia sp. ATCC 39006]
MKKTNKIALSRIAIVLVTILAGSGYVLAEETIGQEAKNIAETTGNKIDSSVQTASGYVDDSALTAKVKAALLASKTLDSDDISVKTTQGVVTLSGFVTSQKLAISAVEIATKTEGVKSVSDKLQVKDASSQSLMAYAGDAVTTSTIKAKLLADDIVPSRHVRVETVDGVVQLTGQVGNKAQSDRAEKIAKSVDGVKSVKNDLTVKS